MLGFVDSFVLYSLFVHLGGFHLLMMKIFQKILQIICVLRWLVGLLVYVLRMCYKFLFVMRKEIQ